MPITDINDKFQKVNLNRPYFFILYIYIKNVDPNLLSIDKIYTRNTDAAVYNIKYIMVESINYQILIVKILFDAYIIEENGNKYLIFVSKKKNKKVLEIYKKLGNKIRRQIKVINGGESIKYNKDFMKIGLD